MIIDCVPTEHKGSLLAKAGICKWSETKGRWMKSLLFAFGHSILNMDQNWWPRKHTENRFLNFYIFKTVTSKIKSSIKLEAEVGFRQRRETGCLCQHSLGISLQKEIKCQDFHAEQVPSLHCHFSFCPLITSGQSKHWASFIHLSFLFLLICVWTDT